MMSWEGCKYLERQVVFLHVFLINVSQPVQCFIHVRTLFQLIWPSQHAFQYHKTNFEHYLHTCNTQ